MNLLSRESRGQLDALCHMLGLSRGVKEPCRNYFAANSYDKEMEELEQRGLVKRWFVQWGWQYYRATPLGIKVALEHCASLQLSRSQRRYRTWLSLNDVIPVSFRDFLTGEEFREIRSKC